MFLKPEKKERGEKSERERARERGGVVERESEDPPGVPNIRHVRHRLSLLVWPSREREEEDVAHQVAVACGHRRRYAGDLRTGHVECQLERLHHVVGAEEAVLQRVHKLVGPAGVF